MKTRNTVFRKTALAAAVVLLVGGVSTMDGSIMPGGTTYSWISSAYAGDDGGGKGGAGGHKGAMGEGRGGEGAKGAGGPGYRGGKSVMDVLADDDGDEDSDRPDWAGVKPSEEPRPGGGGNPLPGETEAKGDTFGDMILLVRDPATGLPILDADADGNEWPQACTSVDCSTFVLMVNNEVPAGETTFEVDLGRGSLVRAPITVIDARLDEALGVITSADSISQDEAGRIVVTTDGVVKTIDSPLENLAIYLDLLKGLADPDIISDAEAALGELATLDTAASLLAGMADKTGDVSLDYLMYENLIGGVVASPDQYFDYSDFSYDRDLYPTTYPIYYLADGAEVPVPETIDIGDYLNFVNGATPADNEYAALFAAAVDDRVEVIELIHTQIVTDDFLNGYVIE